MDEHRWGVVMRLIAALIVAAAINLNHIFEEDNN
jgi:hypothetical protein